MKAPGLVPGHIVVDEQGERTVESVVVCPGCRCRSQCVKVAFADGSRAVYARWVTVQVTEGANA